ncbi:helix-turn-helix domain-containing protein [Brenneria corticis]|uniref:Transcriptional regulator n=1 Tax=Brenneria corticis TaxID=2173106 RepID=A0A2U1U8Y2_9GAMM|nr:helix-turn-helix domain-containing protein [Brenneria sp. CFCC 11842]PWC18128.1 transcriptional regulator [Brenneria sp. CFCC 11842]
MIADALKATEELKAAVPLLAGSTSEKDYRDALALVEHLLMHDPSSPLLDMVCVKIAEYENNLPEVAEFRKHVAALPSGIAVLSTLMEQYHLKQQDFPDEIGSKSLVSRILKGERQLTTEHIRKLSQRFGISPALFI